MTRNGLRLCQGQLRLDIKQNFFTANGSQQWAGLAREAVEAPFQETFKHLDVALGAGFSGGLAVLGWQLDSVIPKVQPQ